MAIFVWLFSVALLQAVSGQLTPFIGQNALNSGQIQQPFSDMNTRGIINDAGTSTMPAANQIARNMAINANSLTNGNANIASGNLANANFVGQHFANNLETGNYANFDNVANSNFISGNLARPDLANQMYQSNFPNPTTHIDTFNGLSSFSPNAINSNYASHNFASKLGGMPNDNLAGNLASGQRDYSNGNIASAINNLANGVHPSGATFKIGDNPFQVIGESPGNHQLGLHVVADTLEVAGTVAVAGKMPIYGTVSLNGNLPTEGKASVNYACTSQSNG